MITNSADAPPLWDDTALQQQAKRALDEFVDRRLAEPSSRYRRHLTERRRALQALFRELARFDPGNPDIEIAKRILSDPELESALRYVVGPPVSRDDLGVLVTRSHQRIGAAAIRSHPTLATDILALICRLADREVSLDDQGEKASAFRDQASRARHDRPARRPSNANGTAELWQNC